MFKHYGFHNFVGNSKVTVRKKYRVKYYAKSRMKLKCYKVEYQKHKKKCL